LTVSPAGVGVGCVLIIIRSPLRWPTDPRRFPVSPRSEYSGVWLFFERMRLIHRSSTLKFDVKLVSIN
jgi:hypothetical protein